MSLAVFAGLAGALAVGLVALGVWVVTGAAMLRHLARTALATRSVRAAL